MTANANEPDTSFGDEPPRKSLARAEQLGDLADGHGGCAPPSRMVRSAPRSGLRPRAHGRAWESRDSSVLGVVFLALDCPAPVRRV
jgi:hypothetical protein